MKTRKKKKYFNGTFTGIDNEIHDSKAFQELTIHARYLYYEFRYRFKGNNKYDIKLPRREIKQIPMAISTFNKCVKQLYEKGLIEIVRRGGIEKQPTIYGLSEKWHKYGTKEFERRKIEDVLPPIYKTKFKKGHEFYGNRYTGIRIKEYHRKSI